MKRAETQASTVWEQIRLLPEETQVQILATQFQIQLEIRSLPRNQMQAKKTIKSYVLVATS